jgi:transcription elongation factor Elf1
MTKLLQESPVFITCPHCGKVQHKKMKWVRSHKSLKCAKCKSKLELAGQALKTQLSETVKAFKAFEKTLMELNKGAIKAVKKGGQKKQKKTAKKSAQKKSRKSAAKKTPAKAAVTTGLGSVAAAHGETPGN